MEVQSFEEIAAEFQRRVNRTVWCSFATVDRRGRPRTRILHPIWDGTTGYILTNRDSFKAKHLARNPYVSLSYWDPNHEQVYIDCRAEWDDAPATKSKVWVMFKAAEPPMAYDPGTIWTGVDDPRLGVMKLTPWRIELFTMADLPTGTHQKVWHA